MEKNSNKKKLIDKNGEKIYPYAEVSKIFYWLTIFFMRATVFMFVFLYLTKGLVWIVKKIVAFLKSIEGIDIQSKESFNSISGFIKTVCSSLFGGLGQAYPNYPNWPNKLSVFFLKLHIPEIIRISIAAIFACGIYYVVTLMFRHHYGEQSPYYDDRMSRKVKKEIIEALDINFHGNEVYGETTNKKKVRITKAKKMVNDTIKQANVQIHTRIDPKDMRTYKEFKVKIRQPKSVQVRNGVLGMIKDLDLVLAGITEGEVAFGKMESEVNRKNFIFRGSVEVERKVARNWNFKWLPKFERKSAKNEKNEITNDSEVTKTTEWAFPLELYTDRTETIESQKALANEFAEEQKSSLDKILIGSNIQATLHSMFVGNTSVQYVYKTAFEKNTTNKVANLADQMEGMLKIRGIQVTLAAGDIEITIPLPNDEHMNYTVPIDVKTMMEQAYAN